MLRLPRSARRARALVRLVRPLNAVMAYVAVLVGGLLTGGETVLGSGRLHLAALSVVLLAGAANADNDRLDLATDRVNRPDRPLPRGDLSERAARWLWIGLTVLGLVLAAGVSALHLGIAAGAAGLLAAYSRWVKAWPLAGNVLVAGILALGLVYGGLAAAPGTGALVAAAFAFLTNLAREIAKDAEDESGDRAAGRRTLAVRWGPEQALRLARCLAALTLVLLPLPYLALDYGGLYLLVSLGVAGALGAALAGQGRGPEAARHSSGALKAAMALGILALALGHATP